YLDVLEAEGLLEVATAAMRRVQELNRVVRVRFEAGAVPRFDILRVQAELAQAREQLISAQNALALARAAFNMLLGRDITTPVHLSKLDSPPPAPASLTAVGAERQLLDLAYAQRPDIQAARKGVELARERLKLARAERNPMVNLVADFHRQTATGLRAAESKSAMLVVQMPIFDSGRVNAQIEEAKANLDSARQQLTALEQQVALEVKQAILNWRSAKERYESARAVLKQAEEAYRIAQLRYESGVGTNVEVLDTQVALTRARTNYVRALHDLHRAYADLDYAVGKPVEQVLAELALRTAQLKPKQ
ncbi:MAG TPA: TolC family protein, partial [Armatimonadetes bacterium]|nr:TolC family protein [Armatimonadota bacterium]